MRGELRFRRALSAIGRLGRRTQDQSNVRLAWPMGCLSLRQSS